MSIVLDGKRHEVKERREGGFMRREEKTTAMVRVSQFYPKFPSKKRLPTFFPSYLSPSLPSYLLTVLPTNLFFCQNLAHRELLDGITFFHWVKNGTCILAPFYRVYSFNPALIIAANQTLPGQLPQLRTVLSKTRLLVHSLCVLKVATLIAIYANFRCIYLRYHSVCGATTLGLCSFCH